MNTLVDRRLQQTPIVMLTNCFRQEKKRKSNETRCESPKKMFLEESANGGLLTPVPSSSRSRSSGSGDFEKRKKRRRSRADDAAEDLWEVEKIVGYHMDNKKRMTYLLKWKGWSSDHNTFHKIEDMENCNKLLMEYFEYEPPTEESMSKINKEVEDSVLKSDLYKRLVKTNFKKSEFLKFMSSPIPDLHTIFSDKYESAYKDMQIEYEYVLRCLLGMQNHRDPGMFARAKRYKIALNVCRMRETQLKRLKQQEAAINAVEKCQVRIVNDKDLDVLPDGVEYTTELKPGKGVNISRDPMVGCVCPQGCKPYSKCCPRAMQSYFAYTKDRKLKWFGGGIYECNWRCKCSADCPNRVVQRGRDIPVAIFKTEHCGWGVKSLTEINRGSFVCEYYGEVITESESTVREVDYFPRNVSYMFSLDFTPDKESKYCVDATRTGNFARYINHSCDPNLIVCPVWINCLDPDLPQLAFFARRHIRRNEELSIDYENRLETDENDENGNGHNSDDKMSALTMQTMGKTRCFCNKPKCRNWLFGSH